MRCLHVAGGPPEDDHEIEYEGRTRNAGMIESDRYIYEGIPRRTIVATISVVSELGEYAKVRTVYEREDVRCEGDPSANGYEHEHVV